MNRRIITAIMLMLLLVAAGCGSQEQASPDIAKVNGESITQLEYDQHYNLIKDNIEQQQGVILDEVKDKELIDRIKSSAFDDLILRTLVRQEAKKQSITVSGAEIDSTLNKFKGQTNKLEVDGYQKFLDSVQMQEDDLRLQLETSILYDELQAQVISGVQVSDTEVENYYSENKIMFKDPGGIQIYHILVATEQQAKDIMEKLKQGDDFAALAQQYSTDPGSKDQGGDVGLVNETTNFVAEFKKAALELQPGDLYPQPVKSEFGYHIIKAGDRTPVKDLAFADMKEQLKMQMEADQKSKMFATYLEDLKTKADILDLRN